MTDYEHLLPHPENEQSTLTPGYRSEMSLVRTLFQSEMEEAGEATRRYEYRTERHPLMQ